MDPAKVDLKTTTSPLDLETTTSRIEDGDNLGVSQSQREKALVRHIDLILMPPLWVMYLFSYADRTKYVLTPSYPSFKCQADLVGKRW